MSMTFLNANPTFLFNHFNHKYQSVLLYINRFMEQYLATMSMTFLNANPSLNAIVIDNHN